ncbi:hypothetical protein [Flavobacterium sp. N2270]|uniref:hypothetical protein n=1 Tax=Flavobacterium sp. N2270 TaxID=2986831 RepID=UPI0029CAB338|nr:hypothetical protein [Flavobacterium sp. N2270]
MNDPAFVRTRENGSEFGRSASSGKLLRDALSSFVFKAKDAKLSSRLMKVMSDVKNQDLVSLRGERNVVEGLATVTGKAYLKGFDFNNRATLRSVFYSPYTVDVATGEISIVDMKPNEQIRFPEGATHFSLQSGFANLDFSTGISAISYSAVTNLPIDGTVSTVTLTPSSVPTGSGTGFVVLLVEFFQEVNGQQYALNNGAYNVLNIVEVV